MDCSQFLLIAGGGLAAGLVGALMGLGGGIIAIPFLNLVVGVPIKIAAAAGLISTVSTSCGTAGRYLRCEEFIEIGTALRIQLVTALGAVGGGVLAGLFRDALLQLLFSAVLSWGAFQVVRSALGSERGPIARAPSRRRILMAEALFFVAGIASGLFGIGGGMLVVPILYLILGLPFKNAAATSNFLMGLTAIPALFAYIGRGELDLSVAVPLAAGVLPGASIGAWLMPRVRTRALKLFFALLLAVVGAQMLRRGILSW